MFSSVHPSLPLSEDLGREWSADSTDVLRVILPTPWWVYVAVVGLVRQQKARCAAHETQIPGLPPQRHIMDKMYQWTVGSEASSEVGKEFCRLASSSIRPVSTSPEAP